MYHETPPEKCETLKEQQRHLLSKSEAEDENRQGDGRCGFRLTSKEGWSYAVAVGRHKTGEVAGKFLQKASAGYGSGKRRECVLTSVRSAELASGSCRRKEGNVSTEAHVFAAGMRSGMSGHRITSVIVRANRRAESVPGSCRRKEEIVFDVVRKLVSETCTEASQLRSSRRIRRVGSAHRFRHCPCESACGIGAGFMQPEGKNVFDAVRKPVSGTCAEASQLRSSKCIRRVGSVHCFRHCPCEPACGISVGFMSPEGGNRVRCSAETSVGNMHRSVTAAFVQVHPARRIVASLPLSLVRTGVRNRCRVDAAGKRKPDWSACRR